MTVVSTGALSSSKPISNLSQQRIELRKNTPIYMSAVILDYDYKELEFVLMSSLDEATARREALDWLQANGFSDIDIDGFRYVRVE